MVVQTDCLTGNYASAYNKSYLSNGYESKPLTKGNLNKLSRQPHKQSECFVCRQPIVVEFRENSIEYDENNINVHADCFECTICGAKLLATNNESVNVDGAPHLLMDGRFYCEMHGVQRQQILSENDKHALSANKKAPARADQIIQLKRDNSGKRNANFSRKPSNTVNQHNVNYPGVQFNSNDKYVPTKCGPKTDSTQWKSKSSLHADMVMTDGNTPLNAPPCKEFFQKSDAAVPRKYKDFTNNEPVHLQQKAKSIQETLQNSQFIQDLKRNLVNRTMKIEESNETKNYYCNSVKTRNTYDLYEKSQRKTVMDNNSNKFHRANAAPTKLNVGTYNNYEDFNLGTKASNLINKFAKDYKLNESNESPFCVQCRRKICGPHVLANGKTYCPEHFTCANSACNRQLLDCGFLECENGGNYCRKCYNMLIAPSCYNCRMPITEDCLNALQKDWHPSCFVCTHCRKPFNGNLSFYLENNLPYCEEDWNNLFTNKCAKCVRPIKTGDCFIEALGSSFHAKCFQCESCHLRLEGETFYTRNGKPYCAAHRK